MGSAIAGGGGGGASGPDRSVFTHSSPGADPQGGAVDLDPEAGVVLNNGGAATGQGEIREHQRQPPSDSYNHSSTCLLGSEAGSQQLTLT